MGSGRWPVANNHWLWPIGYDYEFLRSRNGRSGNAGNGKKILFYISFYGEDCTQNYDDEDNNRLLTSGCCHQTADTRPLTPGR